MGTRQKIPKKVLHIPLFPSHAEASALEAFLLFSQSLPSHNLGFVDSTAARLHLTVADRDLSIVQSPTILSSNRGGGTTGAGMGPPPACPFFTP
jgi:hypothetical protein